MRSLPQPPNAFLSHVLECGPSFGRELNTAGLEFGKRNIGRTVIEGRTVLEVGAYDINGSIRSYIEGFNPASYLGTDIEMGPGVDRIAHVERLAEELQSTYDVIICTEVAEHVRDWRAMVNSLKAVLNPNGHLLLTTRSRGFYYHGYPHDWWRYELSDMEFMFSDFKILALESDTMAPGVFMFAQKPEGSVPRNLDDHSLYSIIKRARVKDVSDQDFKQFQLHYKVRRRFWKIWPKILRFGKNTDWA